MIWYSPELDEFIIITLDNVKLDHQSGMMTTSYNLGGVGIPINIKESDYAWHYVGVL